MSFQQVFYTSCEEGLGNGKGFQVKACSPEISDATLQMVERLGLYVPPLSTPGRPTPEEIAQFPVSLFFQTLNDGSAVLGQAKYIGTDYSGRYGNFFTHSLISANPYADFCQPHPTLPIETWEGQYWVTTENNSLELPVLESIISGQKVDFLNLQPFLQDPVRQQLLPAFLTAAVESLKTGRRIIIVDDNENIAFWIAVAAYTLPYHLALNLTFNTYVQNPYQTESLVTGTTADSSFNFAPHEIEFQFFVFDLKGHRFTKIEPGGFALKASFIYIQADPEAIAGFAPFVEQIAPQLPLDELEDAFSTYCYFENIDLPDVSDAKVLIWSSKYLEKLADKDFHPLLDKVVSKRPVESETLRTATDFYLAALNSKINPSSVLQIESLYLEWLVSEVTQSAEVIALSEAAGKLQQRDYHGENYEKVFTEWLKNLKETSGSAHFIAVLQIGDKLSFLENENDLLRWLGKNVVGKWITDPSIQQIIKTVCNQPGGRKLLQGIGEFLTEQIDNLLLFSALSGLIADPDCYRILSKYAVKTENLLLYIRLESLRANLSSRPADRLNLLQNQLVNIKKDFQTNITGEIIQAAFNTVWLGQTPTLAEAYQLLSPPFREFVVHSEIPSALVDSLNFKVDEAEENEQIKVINALLAKDIYPSLGEKTIILRGYHLAAKLEGDFTDPNGSQIKTHLSWLAENYRHIPQMVPILEESLAQKLIKVVKTPEVHAEILLSCVKENRLNFLKAYQTEAEKIVRERKNQPETARLLRTWIVAAKRSKSFLEMYLHGWSKLLLKSQSHRELEKIEDNLRSMDRDVIDYWYCLKKEIEKNQAGFFKKMFGGIFGER